MSTAAFQSDGDHLDEELILREEEIELEAHYDREAATIAHQHLRTSSLQDPCRRAGADLTPVDRRTSVTDSRHPTAFQGGCRVPCLYCPSMRLPSWPCEGCQRAADLHMVPDHGFDSNVFTPFMAPERRAA